MKRATTGSEAKRANGTGGGSSDQRLVAAGTRALEAYARVIRFAERLGEELDDVTSPHAVPTQLDPEDSMVIAVENVIATAQPTEAPGAPTRSPRTPTQRGIAPLPKSSPKGDQ